MVAWHQSYGGLPSELLFSSENARPLQLISDGWTKNMCPASNTSTAHRQNRVTTPNWRRLILWQPARNQSAPVRAGCHGFLVRCDASAAKKKHRDNPVAVERWPRHDVFAADLIASTPRIGNDLPVDFPTCENAEFKRRAARSFRLHLNACLLSIVSCHH